MHNSISVIIPSKDRERYIKSLLGDLSNQKLEPAEIIIVDQSSNPYSINEKDNLIHLIDDQKGPCHARNLGLKRCTGEIIVFLDDDIRIDSDFLYHLCTPIIENRVLAVVGAMCDSEGNYPVLEYRFWKKEYSNWLLSLTANLDYPGQRLTLSFTTCCAAIHRLVYEEIGGFDLFFDPNGAGEDREYGLRIFHAGYPILFVGDAYAKHLGAKTGGRRKIASRLKYLNPLQANIVYIIAKYFGNKVYFDHCKRWLKQLWLSSISINPRSWLHSIKCYQEGLAWVKYISKIKRNNGW
jgi:GT2 family glycosyltransferase